MPATLTAPPAAPECRPAPCQSADGCTNGAAWHVEGRYVKPHVCCGDCKKQWKRMFVLPGGVKFRRLGKGKS